MRTNSFSLTKRYFQDEGWDLTRHRDNWRVGKYLYNDVIMSAMASQITGLAIVYSTVYSGADQKKKKLRVTGLCEGISPVTGEFPSQRASNMKNVSIWWRHHVPNDSWSLVKITCFDKRLGN